MSRPRKVHPPLKGSFYGILSAIADGKPAASLSPAEKKTLLRSIRRYKETRTAAPPNNSLAKKKTT